MKVHPEVLRHLRTVYSKHPTRGLIHKLLWWNKNLPVHVEERLHEVIKQCQDIYLTLEPLVQMGFTFDMSVVGGSVRDLLLGKADAIKDLDIMISFGQNSSKLLNPKKFMQESNFDFSCAQVQQFMLREGSDEVFAHWNPKFYKKVNKWDRSTKAHNATFFDMIGCALAQKFTLQEVYKPKGNITVENAENYIDTRLEGVIKLKESHWKYPVDILITTYSIENFLRAFDFGICKASFEFTSAAELKLQRYKMPQTPQEIMLRARLEQHFLKDVKNQKISMDVKEHMPLGHVRHSCEIHLPKIQAKYDWPVEIHVEQSFHLDGTAKENNILVKYVNAFFLQRKLNVSLQEKFDLPLKAKRKL